jgi:hypothetical protein
MTSHFTIVFIQYSVNYIYTYIYIYNYYVSVMNILRYYELINDNKFY